MRTLSARWMSESFVSFFFSDATDLSRCSRCRAKSFWMSASTLADSACTSPYRRRHSSLIFTVRRYALHGLCDRNSVRPSVCLSVCPSVTIVHCVHMVRLTNMISSPYDSATILVSEDITFIPKFEGNHPERWRWMRVGWVRTGDFRPISQVSPKRCEIRQSLLLITNRKSNTRFRSVPKSRTFVDPEMT